MVMLVLLPTLGIIEQEAVMCDNVDTSEATSKAMDSEFIAGFETYFHEQMKRLGCPGAAVAIVQGHNIRLLSGYGLRRKGETSNIDEESLFRVGSLSKGFAGVLTSMLVAEGVLQWDEKVRDIVPEFSLKDREQANRITIQHLLSHTTGLQRHAYTDLTEYGRSVEELLPHFASLPVYGREGEYYAYQNTIFSLIETIVERKTGKTYRQVLEEKIFTPAGLEGASTDYASIAKDLNVAFPHVFVKGNRCVPTRLNKKYYNAVSAGGVNASIQDMAQWLKVLLGQRQDIVSASSLDQAFSPFVKNRSNRPFYKWGGVQENHYGMGWRIVDWRDRTLVYHSGSVNNYQAEIALDRERNIGICVLFSSNNRAIDTVVPDFFRMYEDYSTAHSQDGQMARVTVERHISRS